MLTEALLIPLALLFKTATSLELRVDYSKVKIVVTLSQSQWTKINNTQKCLKKC